MIKYKNGDILKSNAEAITNAVNCCGVMGAGLAKQFKDKYPEMYANYRKYCLDGHIRPGVNYYYYDYKAKQWIVNFVTKDDFRDPSQYTYITMGLQCLLEFVKEVGIKSIAIPPLGCGLGGLDFEIVEKMIVDSFRNYEGECIIYKNV